MPKYETKTCHACSETLKWDWEVCPFCGASQQGPAAAAPAPREQDSDEPPLDQFEPAENENVDRRPLPPIFAEPLAPGFLPAADVAYAVMRTDSGTINIPEIGRRLSAILDRPMADITCRIRATRGFLARNVPLACLGEIATLLESQGVQAVAVPEQEISPLPAPYRTTRVIRYQNGLAAAATSPEGATWRLTIDPGRVWLVITGRVMYSALLTVQKPKYDHYARNALLRRRDLKPQDAFRSQQQEVHGHDYEILLFLRDPERLLLIRDAQLDYHKMERLQSDPQRMAGQAQLLAAAIPPARHDDALRLLAWLDEEDPQWVNYTFATQKGFENYAQACLNLGRLNSSRDQRPHGHR